MSLPSLFIPHGAGPCFFMAPEEGFGRMWDGLGDWLRNLSHVAGGTPEAILLISAHWQTLDFAVTAATAPSLIYDYAGFPEHTYQLSYRVPGSPALAQEVARCLVSGGVSCELTVSRGLDHGAFIPLKLAYPEANIPVVQLSLNLCLDAALHYQVGQRLAPLREKGVLIIGSGMSFHNMQPDPGVVAARSEAFDQWLNAAVSIPGEARRNRLVNWMSAPFARFAHPTEEHLIPLLMVCGAAHDGVARRVYHERLGGLVDISAYSFC